jgi:hypothetical protein
MKPSKKDATDCSGGVPGPLVTSSRVATQPSIAHTTSLAPSFFVPLPSGLSAHCPSTSCRGLRLFAPSAGGAEDMHWCGSTEDDTNHHHHHLPLEFQDHIQTDLYLFRLSGLNSLCVQFYSPRFRSRSIRVQLIPLWFHSNSARSSICSESGTHRSLPAPGISSSHCHRWYLTHPLFSLRQTVNFGL